MDKSWIKKDRDSLEYEIGVEKFLIFAEENAKDPQSIPCPCSRCVNFKKFTIKVIRGHLYDKGFSLGYLEWIWHGEESSRTTKSSAGSCPGGNLDSDTIGVCEAAYSKDNYDNESSNFKKFVSDAEQPLFEGSECNKLESMLKLHNWKARFGISDTAFSDLLFNIGSFLPKDHVLPVNAYEAKKTLSDLGLEYVKFHSCPNECILYRGMYLNASDCPKCHLSRWKVGKDGKVRVNIPAKVMWYFPIIPRLKRLFKSPSTAELMTWHANNRIQDGKMRHPADSPSWRNIDYRWPSFGSEARNIRLALAADGINPHNNGLSNRYSIWPVVLVNYNLPPWLCMKRKFMMLTILVSGPHEPGNNIDIYLEPLIDDLKKLWEFGESNVYDAFTKSYFTLKAMLMWTINDFPAYGNLSGCVNKGYLACPICNDDTVAKYLSHSRKMCYQGHRRYLGKYHPYRRQKKTFNGEQELGEARQPLTGEEVLARQDQIKFSFGKEVKKSKKVDCPWKKKSIFFQLEYWKFHYVRHCLDVMHIEKNVCDNVIGTLLNIRFKSKDSVASRLDMNDMGVRLDLAPQVGEKRTYLPPSAFTLSKAEKKKMLSSFLFMKLPYGHASNIKNCVSMDDLKMYGLKSHDCHILLQQLLPVAIRSILPKHVRITIIRLCFFFNSLCNKVVDVSKLDKLHSDVILTLCELEKVFHASFRTIFKSELKKLHEGKLNRNIPNKYKLLYKHASTIMKDTGESVQIPCDPDVFGTGMTKFILNENIIALLEFNMIGQSVISAYIAYLHTLVGKKHKNDNLSLFGFVDPGVTFNLNNEFQSHVLNRLREGHYYRVYFMPHNQDSHWILVIIWDGDIYLLNPLSHATHFVKLENALISVLKSYHAETGRGRATEIKYLQGSPKQPGGTECGYVVMRYMRDIIYDKEMSFTTKWATKNRKCYTMQELDEVRMEALDFIADKM